MTTGDGVLYLPPTEHDEPDAPEFAWVLMLADEDVAAWVPARGTERAIEGMLHELWNAGRDHAVYSAERADLLLEKAQRRDALAQLMPAVTLPRESWQPDQQILAARANKARDAEVAAYWGARSAEHAAGWPAQPVRSRRHG